MNPTQLSVRPATVDDLAALKKFGKQCVFLRTTLKNV
jgi:hypothetical protein